MRVLAFFAGEAALGLRGLAGGLASVVWGGTSVLIGIVAALASGVVGLGIAWLARVAAWRSVASPPSP